MDIDTKVVVVGDSGAGKTTFVAKLLNGVFRQDPSSTIGAAVQTYHINEHKFIFWDTAGQERYRSLIPMYYRRANCVLLFYDMSDLNKHDGIPGWLKDIKSNTKPGMPVIMIGSKSDKEDSIELDYEREDIKEEMKNLNIIAKIVISSKEETKKELLAKFSDLFDTAYEYATNHQKPTNGVVKVENTGVYGIIKTNTEYYTWGYCNIL